MINKVNPYNEIVRVFDFKEDFVKYINSKKSEAWKTITSDYNNVQLWINKNGQIISFQEDESFYTLFNSLAGFKLVQQHKKKSAFKLNELIPVNNDNPLPVVANRLAHEFCKKMKVAEKAQFTKAEFEKLALLCTYKELDLRENLDLLVSYCGEFIINASPSYQWYMGECSEPSIIIDNNNDRIIGMISNFLHSADKRYSEEFLWGGIPSDIIDDYLKKTGEFIYSSAPVPEIILPISRPRRPNND